MTITKDTIITSDIIDNLKIGDICPNVFGQMKPITKIYAKDKNEKTGKKFACFYQVSNTVTGSAMSNDLHEGKKPYILY
jgi:hypothetical protein